ncbi:hypothetical protein BH23ACT7_BH23ACT7_04750 [soil metagenome]|jgi:hypothetical protein|nr:hypothetical protein [Euzebyaceae bacterium]
MYYDRLVLSARFLRDIVSADFTPQDSRDILQALRVLDGQDDTPVVAVHRLEGDRTGAFAAEVSPTVRVTFEHLDGGQLQMLTCEKLA